MRFPCRTKELQLTDCQAQHCRAKREPLTDFWTLVDRRRHQRGPPQSVRFSAGLARTNWHATDVYAPAALAMTSEPGEDDFSDATSI